MTTDLHFDSVSLLLHCDGANGSTTFLDSSARPKTVAANGSVAITTAHSMFGGACGDFAGGYLTIPASADFVFGAGDFTLEFWIKTSKSTGFLVLEHGEDWYLECFEGIFYWGDNGSGGGAALASSASIANGQWHHIAITKQSGTQRVFVDGALEGEHSNPAVYDAAPTLSIGAPITYDYAPQHFRGHLDELRITKGVARYTSAFAVPTEAFPGGGAPATEGFLAAAASPLGAPRALATASEYLCTALASAPSPLGRAVAKGLHDFTGLLGDASTRYVMDLITPAGRVRAPISSWQATLQTGSSNYVQCVVPACAPYAAQINSATEFVIYRRAELPDGSALEYEMARAPTGQVRFDRGPQRHTCTLAGYSTAFVADENPPAAYNRALVAVRSISSGQGGMRVRCAVDWLLRPGHRAFADGAPLVVSYINYYAPSGGDGYMDVGERT